MLILFLLPFWVSLFWIYQDNFSSLDIDPDKYLQYCIQWFSTHDWEKTDAFRQRAHMRVYARFRTARILMDQLAGESLSQNHTISGYDCGFVEQEYLITNPEVFSRPFQ